MKRDDMIRIEGYFEAFIIIFLIFLFLLMLSDYILAILFASSLVFLLYKPYLYLRKRINEYAAAFFMTLLVTISLFLPLYFVGMSIYSESSELISNSDELISNLSFENCTFRACGTFQKNLVLIGLNIDSLTTKIASYFSNSLGALFTSLTSIIINIFIFILSLFFFLKDGEKFMKYVKRIIPMKNAYKEALFLRFRQVSSAVFIDSILVALIQGVLVGIGLYFTGFSSPVFWSIIAAFMALLPFIGAAFIWLPASIFLLLMGDFTLGIGFLLYGVFIVSMSDNILRPILMHHKVPVHSFLIFLSILGGVGFFGILGLFLGPIIISLLVSVLQLYKLDFK